MITSQIDKTRVYPNYQNGTVEPVIEYFIKDPVDGEKAGPFLTRAAAQFVLDLKKSVRDSKSQRLGYKRVAE